MVEPITIAVASAAIGGASKIAGGIFGAARARARGEYLASQAEEQRQLYARQFNREFAKRTAQKANTGGRGIAVSGSVVDDIYSQSFDLILQRETVKQRLSQSASQARVTGSIQSAASLGQGFGAGFGDVLEAGTEFAKSKAGSKDVGSQDGGDEKVS